MNKLHILIVSRDFSPIISARSSRTTELVKELVKQGHLITLVTPVIDPIQYELAEELGFKIIDMGRQKWKTPKFGSSKSGTLLTTAISRLLSISIEYPNIELMFKVNSAIKGLQNFDLMISIAKPYAIHWGVALARKRNSKIAKVWVADCGDPYMFESNDTFKKFFYLKYLEKWFSRKAEFISIPRIEMIKNYFPEFHKKIIDIPQGFKFETIKNENPQPINDIPVFVFAGGFIKEKRDPRPLLEFLAKTDNKFKFKIYTYTPDIVLHYKNTLGDRLEINSIIPREKLQEVLKKADFLVNISYDPVNQSPSKLIDYAIAGRPILSIDTTSLDENLINEFLKGNYERRFTVIDIEKFKIENVARSFLSLLT